MGSGQMMLTIVGMMLLGNIILTANRGINNIQATMLNTGYDIDAVSIARSTMEKAQDLAFDENTQDSTWQNSLSSLTTPANLGVDSHDDTTIQYDDYDDYNNRVEVDTLMANGKNYAMYKVKTTVQYVTRNSSGSIVPSPSTRTWSKQLDVWVWKYEPNIDTVVQKKDSLATVVHMFDIFSYWY